MSEIYPYADENRLISPHSYMYPPLHGTAFFAAYKDSRLASLNIFAVAGHGDEKICSLPIGVADAVHTACRVLGSDTLLLPLSVRKDIDGRICCQIRDEGREIVPRYAAHQNGIVQTDMALEGLLNALPEFSGDASAWADFFLGRFEITKRIYERYIFPSRKGDGSSNCLSLYVKCALLFGCLFFYRDDLRFLNVLLKINDLLCSAVNELHGQDAEFAGCSLLLETAATANILERMQEPHAHS